METSHYPFATQDWALIRHRTLTLQAHQVRAVEAVKGELWITVDGNCNDFFVRAGETIAISSRSGQVVIESTSSTSIARVALAAQSPLLTHAGPTFSEALSRSMFRPLASLSLMTARNLHAFARWLSPGTVH
jgi:Protein of unknown function (DUF2917)